MSVAACSHLASAKARGTPSRTGMLRRPWAAIAALLVWEHRLVRPDDLSRVNQAFFTANAAIGLVLLAAITADLWL